MPLFGTKKNQDDKEDSILKQKEYYSTQIKNAQERYNIKIEQAKQHLTQKEKRQAAVCCKNAILCEKEIEKYKNFINYEEKKSRDLDMDVVRMAHSTSGKCGFLLHNDMFDPDEVLDLLEKLEHEIDETKKSEEKDTLDFKELGKQF